MSSELEKQEVGCEIVSPSNNRNRTFMKRQPHGSLNNDNTNRYANMDGRNLSGPTSKQRDTGN